MKLAAPTAYVAPIGARLEDLPQSLARRIITELPGDAAARLGCASRRWRAQSAEHPLLAPLRATETAQERATSIIGANQPAALARFLVAYNEEARYDIVNSQDDCGLTLLMYMATLRRPEGGGIHLASVLIGMGADPQAREDNFTAAGFAAMAGNQKLAFWLSHAESLGPLPNHMSIDMAVAWNLPHLVRTAARTQTLDFEAMALALGYRSLQASSSARILATWRVLLDLHPSWCSDAVADEQAHALVITVLKSPAALPLLRFLNDAGILAKAMRHADILEPAITSPHADEVVRYLVPVMDEASSKQAYSTDALRLALQHGSTDAFLLMLSCGADPGGLDAQGRSLLGHALRCGNAGAYLILKHHGTTFSAKDQPMVAAIERLCNEQRDCDNIAFEILRFLPCSKLELKKALRLAGKLISGKRLAILEAELHARIAAGS